MTRRFQPVANKLLRRVTDTQMFSSGPYDASPNLRNGIFPMRLSAFLWCYSDNHGLWHICLHCCPLRVHGWQPGIKAYFSKHHDNTSQITLWQWYMSLSLLMKGQDEAWNTHFKVRWAADYLRGDHSWWQRVVKLGTYGWAAKTCIPFWTFHRSFPHTWLWSEMKMICENFSTCIFWVGTSPCSGKNI